MLKIEPTECEYPLSESSTEGERTVAVARNDCE